MSRIVVMMLMGTVLLIGGCERVKVSDKDLEEVTESQVAELSVKETVALIDVRKPEHFAAGHIPGAVNIYLPEIRASDKRLAGAKQIIVYGDGWTDPLPTAGAKRLIALKYGNVFLFRGGMEVWTKAGRSIVESGTPSEARPETEK